MLSPAYLSPFSNKVALFIKSVNLYFENGNKRFNVYLYIQIYKLYISINTNIHTMHIFLVVSHHGSYLAQYGLLKFEKFCNMNDTLGRDIGIS